MSEERGFLVGSWTGEAVHDSNRQLREERGGKTLAHPWCCEPPASPRAAIAIIGRRKAGVVVFARYCPCLQANCEGKKLRSGKHLSQRTSSGLDQGFLLLPPHIGDATLLSWTIVSESSPMVLHAYPHNPTQELSFHSRTNSKSNTRCLTLHMLPAGVAPLLSPHPSPLDKSNRLQAPLCIPFKTMGELDEVLYTERALSVNHFPDRKRI